MLKKRILNLMLIFILLLSGQLYLISSKTNNQDKKKTVYFYPNTDTVIETSMKILTNIINELKNNEKIKVKLDGHTNSVGKEEAEMILSKERAYKIMNFLIEAGINKNRIETEYFGGTKPAVSDIKPANRRVEVNLLMPVNNEKIEQSGNVVKKEEIKRIEKELTVNVSDEEGNKLEADLEIKKNINGNTELLSTERVDTSKMLIVPRNTDLEILASSNGYMPKKVIVKSNDEIVNIIMEKINLGQAYSVDNIYFESMKSRILKESYDIINEIIDVLKSDNNLKLEVRGHTQAAYQKLSDARAEAVTNYIIRRGISAERLISKGLSNKEKKEYAKKTKGIVNNKRVEFIFF